MECVTPVVLVVVVRIIYGILESHLKLYQPVSLPQDLSPNTHDTVGGLTEHLMQCLQVNNLSAVLLSTA